MAVSQARLAWHQRVAGRSRALRLEARLKRLPRAAKLALVRRGGRFAPRLGPQR